MADQVLDEARARAVRPRRGRRIAVILAVLVLVLVVIAGGAVYLVSESLGDNVTRLPGVFGTIPTSERPAEGDGLTFLIVGTDTRSSEPTTGTDASPDVNAGSQRSDVIMLARLAPDNKSAAVVSIPRDSWVDIPGRGKNKINAAYAFGGPALLVRTVEQLTGVRIDHFSVVDFAGFQSMVDAVGGIDVQVAQSTSNDGVTFRQGENHLSGADALAYVRQRHGLPGGDLDRAHREQNALKALLKKAGSSYGNPVELFKLVDATSHYVSVDDTLTNGRLRELALNASGLRPSAVTFLNAPVAGFGKEGAQDVDYLDAKRSADLWTALLTGRTTEYAATHPSDKLAEVPA